MLENNECISIGKVAKIIGVEAHTIRFWIGEFGDAIPFIVGKGDRRYFNDASLEKFKLIKNLIHDKGIKIRIIKEQNLLSPIAKQNNAIERNVDRIQILTIIAEIRQIINNAISKGRSC